MAMEAVTDLAPGDLIFAECEGYGTWPSIVMSRCAYLKSTVSTHERLAPRKSVYLLTLGDRHLTFLDPKHIHRNEKTSPQKTKLFLTAMKEKEDYLNGKIKQFALWFYKNHHHPYVAEFVSASDDVIILRTIEATTLSNPTGEEVVPRCDWKDICFIGKSPLSMDPSVVLHKTEPTKPHKRKVGHGPPMTIDAKKAIEDIRQKRLASDARKQQRIIQEQEEKKKQEETKRALYLELFGEDFD